MTKIIHANTHLNVIINLDPRIVDYIVALQPHEFERLHNPIMRRLMSPRISIGRVAVMVGRPVEEILAHIATLADVEIVPVDEKTHPQSPSEVPDWVENADPEQITVVDLLPIDATLDADPFPPVSLAVKKLAAGEILLIKHKWEPQPFYDVWSQMGNLVWYAEAISADEWWIWVKRLAENQRSAGAM